jgi:hypothetical protein
MVEAEGYPKNKGAIARVAAHLNMQERTLRRWVKGESNPPPDTAVNVKRIDLQRAINNELAAIFAEMGKARADASYKDLTTAAGILIDKKLLLSGEPTANTNQRIVIEYLDDQDIVTEATAVAERHYQAGAEI